jgi:hypothetical protein
MPLEIKEKLTEALDTLILFILSPFSSYIMGKMHVRREIACDVLISSEWTIITPQPPMKIEKRFQEISLKLEDCRHHNERNNLIFPDGTVIKPEKEIFVEISDEYRNKYNLKGGRYKVNNYDEKSKTFAVHSAGFATKHPNDLPADRTYTEVRIRSKKPFRCKKIIWHNYNMK